MKIWNELVGNCNLTLWAVHPHPTSLPLSSDTAAGTSRWRQPVRSRWDRRCYASLLSDPVHKQKY